MELYMLLLLAGAGYCAEEPERLVPANNYDVSEKPATPDEIARLKLPKDEHPVVRQNFLRIGGDEFPLSPSRIFPPAPDRTPGAQRKDGFDRSSLRVRDLSSDMRTIFVTWSTPFYGVNFFRCSGFLVLRRIERKDTVSYRLLLRDFYDSHFRGSDRTSWSSTTDVWLADANLLFLSRTDAEHNIWGAKKQLRKPEGHLNDELMSEMRKTEVFQFLITPQGLRPVMKTVTLDCDRPTVTKPELQEYLQSRDLPAGEPDSQGFPLILSRETTFEYESLRPGEEFTFLSPRIGGGE